MKNQRTDSKGCWKPHELMIYDTSMFLLVLGSKAENWHECMVTMVFGLLQHTE